VWSHADITTIESVQRLTSIHKEITRTKQSATYKAS